MWMAELEDAIEKRHRRREGFNETLKTMSLAILAVLKRGESECDMEEDLEIEIANTNLALGKKDLKNSGGIIKTYAEMTKDGVLRSEHAGVKEEKQKQKYLALIQPGSNHTVREIVQIIRENIDPITNVARIKDITKQGKILIESGAREEKESLEKALRECEDISKKCDIRHPKGKKMKILFSIPNNIESRY